jgi:hypothetical protein
MTLPSKSNQHSLRPSKDEGAFAEIVQLIAAAREQAVRDVNTILIDLYWKVGEIISRKIEAAEWGDATVDRLAQYIARTQPGIRGFSRPNLFRMRQFYETYKDDGRITSSSWDKVSVGKSASSICVSRFRKGGANASLSVNSIQILQM